jgi:RNA polymerase sigma-70 factor, ECF subfamily
LDESPSLVTRAQRQDQAAFSELVRRHERTALAIAYAVVGDASLARDVVQEAFLRTWQRLGDLDAPARFPAWIARIVRNEATDHLRRGRGRFAARTAGDEGAVSPDGPRCVVDPAAEADRHEMRGSINIALAQLDDLTRAAVVLRYYQDLSSKEIGELLELSPAAVDMRLSRARAQLKQLLAPIVSGASIPRERG